MTVDTEPGAQPGELPGDRAVQRQRAGRGQRGDDVTGPVGDKRVQAAIGSGSCPELFCEKSAAVVRMRGGDDVQQELTGPAHGPSDLGSAIWHQWMFYVNLSTVHVITRLMNRKGRQGVGTAGKGSLGQSARTNRI